MCACKVIRLTFVIWYITNSDSSKEWVSEVGLDLVLCNIAIWAQLHKDMLLQKPTTLLCGI